MSHQIVMLSRISLIKIAVLIYILCFSSETSTLISFGIIYSKKHSILQSDGYPHCDIYDTLYSINSKNSSPGGKRLFNSTIK